MKTKGKAKRSGPVYHMLDERFGRVDSFRARCGVTNRGDTIGNNKNRVTCIACKYWMKEDKENGSAKR